MTMVYKWATGFSWVSLNLIPAKFPVMIGMEPVGKFRCTLIFGLWLFLSFCFLLFLLHSISKEFLTRLSIGFPINYVRQNKEEKNQCAFFLFQKRVAFGQWVLHYSDAIGVIITKMVPMNPFFPHSIPLASPGLNENAFKNF